MVAITLYLAFNGFFLFVYYNSMRDKLVNMLVFTSRLGELRAAQYNNYVLA